MSLYVVKVVKNHKKDTEYVMKIYYILWCYQIMVIESRRHQLAFRNNLAESGSHLQAHNVICQMLSPEYSSNPIIVGYRKRTEAVCESDGYLDSKYACQSS